MNTIPKITKVSDTTFTVEVTHSVDDAKYELEQAQTEVVNQTQLMSDFKRQVDIFQAQIADAQGKLDDAQKIVDYWSSVVDQAKTQGIVAVAEVAPVDVISPVDTPM